MSLEHANDSKVFVSANLLEQWEKGCQLGSDSAQAAAFGVGMLQVTPRPGENVSGGFINQSPAAGGEKLYPAAADPDPVLIRISQVS